MQANICFIQSNDSDRDLILSLGILLFTRPDGALMVDTDDLTEEDTEPMEVNGISVPDNADFIIYHP